MTQVISIDRPELTISDGVAAHLSAADVILEFGVGVSTVMAAEMAGKTITSVETDQFWVVSSNEWFEQNTGKSKPDIIWANISQTKAWSCPKTEKHWKDYAKYSLEIWSLEGLPDPDVVLVDGRFRAGCILSTAFQTRKPTRVLVDDYEHRPSYPAVEKTADAPRLIGRMAEFEITLTPIPARHLLEIITPMQDPY